MRLGGSMKRRRERSGAAKKKKAGPRTAAGWLPAGWRLPRLQGGVPSLLTVVLLGILGVGSGYLVATQFLFPAPASVQNFVSVPDLQGMNAEEASEALAAHALRIGLVDSVRHPEVPDGEIVGQSPFPGQLSAPDGEVRLTLSLGPETRPVPDILRLRGDRAQTVLQASGFAVVVDSVESTLPMGRVVSVEPEVGTNTVLPAEVALVVSLGPPLVELPDLRGLQEEEAIAILDSLGLVVGEVETRFRFGFRRGEVLDQDPPPEVEVEKGSAVRLIVGQRGILPGNPEGREP